MDQNNESAKVVFENEKFQRSQSFQTPTSKIVQLVIKYSGGIVKDEKQANYVLIGFVVVAVVVVIIFLFSGGSDSSKILQENFQNKTQFLP